MRRLILGAMVAAACSPAWAEVVETSAQGFRLQSVQQIAASPAKVFAALGEIGRWWSDTHTYSGKAANMTLQLSANACFCETLPNGGTVRHGVVEAVMPGRLLRLDSALGPLQDEGVSAALSFSLKPMASGTQLMVTYNVGGTRPSMLAIASGVDGVVTEQAVRLKRYVETGHPE